MHKTNAARLLDGMKISYTMEAYHLDEHDLSAEHIAELNHFDLARLFKTLVIRGDKTGVMIACLPGGAEVNLKSLAAVSGNKKVEMVPQKEIQGLTGYIRGSVSPIGLKKNHPVYLDTSALNHESIMINAGHKGILLQIAPQDLVKAVEAKIIQLTGS